MKLVKLLIILCSLLITLGNAHAQKLMSADDIHLSIPVDENLYIAGGSISINKPVHGDVVLAGGNIIINDSVTGDVLVTGGTLYIYGYAGDDIRCAGGEIHIYGPVQGDVVVGGGKVVLHENATVNGSVLAGTGDLTIDGNIKHNARIGTGTFRLNGTIGQDLECRGGDININGSVSGTSLLSAANKIILGPNAAFHNNVRYWQKAGKTNFGNSVKNGTSFFDTSLKMENGRWQYLGFASMLFALWYLGMALVFILLFLYLFGGLFGRAAVTAGSTTARSLGYGALFFLGVPVVAVLLIVTIIGLPLGIMAIVVYAMLMILASVICAVLITYILRNRYHRSWGFWPMAFISLAIFIGLKLISLIPIAGWLILFFIGAICFGALLLNIHWRRRDTHLATQQ